jgi:hypothetical protein
MIQEISVPIFKQMTSGNALNGGVIAGVAV